VLYRLLVLTGLRRGEAVGPRWSALDLLNGTLTVHRQVVHVAGALIEGPPKSEAGRRTVALDQGTVDLLRLSLSAQPDAAAGTVRDERAALGDEQGLQVGPALVGAGAQIAVERADGPGTHVDRADLGARALDHSHTVVEVDSLDVRPQASKMRTPQSSSTRITASSRRSGRVLPLHACTSAASSVSVSTGTGLAWALGASSLAIGLAPISPSATSQPQNRCSPLCRVRTVDSS
jgi:integrase